MDRLFDVLVYHVVRSGLSDAASEEIQDALSAACAEVRVLRQQIWELQQANTPPEGNKA